MAYTYGNLLCWTSTPHSPPSLSTRYTRRRLSRVAGRPVKRGAGSLGGADGVGGYGAGAAGEDGQEPARGVPPAHGKKRKRAGGGGRIELTGQRGA